MLTEAELIEAFKYKKAFSREELFEFFRESEPDLNEGTFGWRIHHLKNKNIIKSVKRGLYVISFKPKYKPVVSPEALMLAEVVSEQLDGAKHSIWETGWLNEFSQHQPGKNIIIIEVEKGYEEFLYDFLAYNESCDLFLNPGEMEFSFYISERDYPVIINKLITRAPIASRTENKVKFYTPLLEKILVDLFADELTLTLYQGAELLHIYERALAGYTINFTKLFSYARRREKEQELKSFLTEHLSHLTKGIIDG